MNQHPRHRRARGSRSRWSLSAVSACGEGQFNMGQGLRYQGYLAPHPATVLVYDDGAATARRCMPGCRKPGTRSPWSATPTRCRRRCGQAASTW